MFKIEWRKFNIPENPMLKVLENTKEDYEDSNDELEEKDFYNFWICNTNFNITNGIVDSVQYVEGVETLELVSRYKMRVGIGELFDEDDVKDNIEMVMKQIVDPVSGIVSKLVFEGSVFWAVIEDENGKFKGVKANSAEQLEKIIKNKKVVKTWEKD